MCREEQKRLEELLERFPTEETEMERWKKIATEMGNRTPVQVHIAHSTLNTARIILCDLCAIGCRVPTSKV